MTPIYEYNDYRAFLRDRFSALKKQNPMFSYRAFNRLAGLKNSGFLKLVIDGQKNLGQTGIWKMARGFKLTEDEARYFAALVHFNQAKEIDEKNHYKQEIQRCMNLLKINPILK